MINLKDRFFLFCEKKMPIYTCLIIILFCAYFRFNLKIFCNNGNSDILTTTITVTSILISVMMSMLGFLLTVSARRIIKDIIKLGVHKMILKYFIRPISVGIIIVISSITIKAAVIANNVFDNAILSSLWLVLCTYFITSFIRIVMLMYMILISAFEDIIEDDSDNKTLKSYDDIIKKQDLKFDDPDDFYNSI